MKPSEIFEKRIEKLGGSLRSRQVKVLLEILDDEWHEKHQRHTNSGESCKECREYNFKILTPAPKGVGSALRQTPRGSK